MDDLTYSFTTSYEFGNIITSIFFFSEREPQASRGLSAHPKSDNFQVVNPKLESMQSVFEIRLVATGL